MREDESRRVSLEVMLRGLHAGLGLNLHLANLLAIVVAAGGNSTLSLRHGWRAETSHTSEPV